MVVKNIAICLSTEPRYWEVTAFNINHIKKWAKEKNINLHIFYHAWDHISIRWPRKEYIDIFNTNNYDTKDFIITDVEKNKIEDNIQPTASIIENKDVLDYSIDKIYKMSDRYVTNKKHLEYKIKYTNEPCISQIYSMLKSFKIMADYGVQNNIHYDLVIRNRFDQSIYNIFYNEPTQNCYNRMFAKQNALEYLNPKVLKYSTRRDGKLQQNILCPRFALNWKRKLWMEYCVFLATSYTINNETLIDFEDRLIDLAVALRSNGTILETSSHWVVAEYVLQHFKAGITNPKPVHRWIYKLNHLERTITTKKEYDEMNTMFLEKEKNKPEYKYLNF